MELFFHTYFTETKLLWKCLCLPVRNGSGKFGGRNYTTVVICDPSYLICFVCNMSDVLCVHDASITSGRNRGTAAEADAVREQQLKRTQLGLRSVWPRETSAHQRHYRTRLLVCQSRGLCQTHADMVKEVRPQMHNYVCSEERTVVCHAVLTQTEVRAPLTSVLWRAVGAGVTGNLIQAYTDPGRSYLIADSIRWNEFTSKSIHPRMNFTSGFDPSPWKRSDFQGTSVPHDGITGCHEGV